MTDTRAERTERVHDSNDASRAPVASLFDEVVGQFSAVAQLRASARRPVHAYLLVGPPGSGKRAAARGFAASLLCPDGGCGECGTCRRALAGTHPDLVVVERTGASLDVDEARTIVARAQRRPFEADRQVLLVTDLHLAGKAGPALLKTVEEPPLATVFVLLADELSPGLATIASRCVKVVFEPVPVDAVTAWLIEHGVDPAVARSVATQSGGRLDRATLLATDPGFADRMNRWRSVPTRLDGTGAAAATIATELLASAESALGPVRQQHDAEMAELTERAEATGLRGIPGRKDVEDRHKREERRWRSDEMRTGLAVLSGAYRDRLVASTGSSAGSESPGADAENRRMVADVAAIEQAARVLGRNPNEALLLESLMVTLSGMAD
jgi:DNA polymerase III subunit delta'